MLTQTEENLLGTVIIIATFIACGFLEGAWLAEAAVHIEGMQSFGISAIGEIAMLAADE